MVDAKDDAAPHDAPTSGPGDITYGPLGDDEKTVMRIYQRYSGQFDKLEFEHADVIAQLALDIGILVGMSMRLLRERERV